MTGHRLIAALLISLLLHAGLLAAVWPRKSVDRGGTPPLASVELVIVERQGDARTEEPDTAAATEPAPVAASANAGADGAAVRTSGEVMPSAASPPPLKISLRGTDSPSDAVSEGSHVIPAAADAVFHNRPPAYPPEASRNRQTGTVILALRVAPGGQAIAVDVEDSSGHVLLDRAARDAVANWRFLPAVKDGKPVESEIRVRIVFENE